MTERTEGKQGRIQDAAEGLSWAAVGCAILVLSLQMDRLSQQGVPSYAVPGLLPGLLGLIMIVSGLLLAVRSRGEAEQKTQTQPSGAESASARTLIVIGLCLAFSFGLIGHGVPFWLAAALFVTAAILVLNTPLRGNRYDLRSIAFAVALGLGAGVATTLVFQEIFLVRLP